MRFLCYDNYKMFAIRQTVLSKGGDAVTRTRKGSEFLNSTTDLENYFVSWISKREDMPSFCAIYGDIIYRNKEELKKVDEKEIF